MRRLTGTLAGLVALLAFASQGYATTGRAFFDVGPTMFNVTGLTAGGVCGHSVTFTSPAINVQARASTVVPLSTSLAVAGTWVTSLNTAPAIGAGGIWGTILSPSVWFSDRCRSAVPPAGSSYRVVAMAGLLPGFRVGAGVDPLDDAYAVFDLNGVAVSETEGIEFIVNDDLVSVDPTPDGSGPLSAVQILAAACDQFDALGFVTDLDTMNGTLTILNIGTDENGDNLAGIGVSDYPGTLDGGVTIMPEPSALTMLIVGGFLAAARKR